MAISRTVVNDEVVTTTSNLIFKGALAEQRSRLTSLALADDELMNSWYGVAGDAFVAMANVVEMNAGVTKLFTENSVKALADVMVHFNKEDEARRDSISDEYVL